MDGNSNQVGDDLIRLAGARYITAAETEHGHRFADAKINSFAGGDIISARPLYCELVNFQPIGKIFRITKNRPKILDSDDGIWRRMMEIPFERQFAAN